MLFPGFALESTVGVPVDAFTIDEDVILRTVVEAASDYDGWARISTIGRLLTKSCPDFGSRTYGYQKLSDLIAASPLFETTRRSLPNDFTEIFVRDKRREPEE
ncbi:hypothetical protein ANOM_009453 [Aspergillus nomiae NRRL 13137]|uniref:HTH OST-type domain-containing protein n=1 Tax=Aspergillus nomiae NRRL (strain ATCC 15546 / NRRL 13137 / CBS 260.88 / M93) TaxID=1509407 RepID=A0A0L1ITR9_ASPN3|nr:uncharacterized protein ANOM_009453 [Aspergillus nomiae NRRL 13137]KNG82946.1 hypothetical protein ANOM_009453 [Aspergillus nomiae NRRL 13137]